MKTLLDSASAWVDGIRLNVSTRDGHGGRAVLRKRRRAGAALVARLANAFFRLARNPVEVMARGDEWRAWEAKWFRRLHGETVRNGAPGTDAAGTDADGALWTALLPGRSLSEHLAAGTLQPAHLAAAGEELRRAHTFHCTHHGGGWSHGDSHTGNFIFDAATGRARIVDFEVRHLRTIPEPERHADDLLVMLQDVCGRCRAEHWLPLAGAFLDGYGRPEIAARLPAKLRVPRGIPRVWWAVRTTWMRGAELERRLALLREHLRTPHGPLAAVRRRMHSGPQIGADENWLERHVTATRRPND